MKKIAVRNIVRAPAEHVERLGQFGTATVHEEQGRTGLMDNGIQPVWRGPRISGSAVTTLCAPGDNLMLHVGISLVRPGDVLVVAVTSPCSDGYLGDLLATSLAARGATGVILDCGARDAAEITGMGFPVWSRGLSAQGTVKETVCAANVPVICAGVLVTPGDIIVADDDGVCVVPRDTAAAVIAASEAREAKEALLREKLHAGELSLDLLGLAPLLETRGLQYLDLDEA